MSASGEMDGVLICGAYGSGKSSLAAEIAETLERRDVAYAAVDLDWLMWFGVPDMHEAEAHDIFLANVSSVVENYRGFGVRHVVLALAVRDREEVEALERAARIPLRVVRVDVPFAEISRRLVADPTSGRRDDLAVAEQWLADGVGAGFEDLVVSNDRDLAVVAQQIIDWLGWTA